MDDGHEIFCELLFGRAYDLVLNHDSCIPPPTYPFEKVESESTQSIPVRDNNFFDMSFENGVNHSQKTFPFEVDP